MSKIELTPEQIDIVMSQLDIGDCKDHHNLRWKSKDLNDIIDIFSKEAKPKELYGFVNIYSGGRARVHSTAEAAALDLFDGKIACIDLSVFSVGHGIYQSVK